MNLFKKSITIGLALSVLLFAETSLSTPKALPNVGDKHSSKGTDMSNKEIDEIFISFSKERETEKRKREEEALKKDKPLDNGGNRFVGGGLSNDKRMGNPVLPHVPDENTVSPEDILRSQLEQMKNAVIPPTDSEKINGISCEKSVCVAFVGTKILKKGDFLSPLEKIVLITPVLLKTTLRKIKF